MTIRDLIAEVGALGFTSLNSKEDKSAPTLAPPHADQTEPSPGLRYASSHSTRPPHTAPSCIEVARGRHAVTKSSSRRQAGSSTHSTYSVLRVSSVFSSPRRQAGSGTHSPYSTSLLRVLPPPLLFSSPAQTAAHVHQALGGAEEHRITCHRRLGSMQLSLRSSCGATSVGTAPTLPRARASSTPLPDPGGARRMGRRPARRRRR